MSSENSWEVQSDDIRLRSYLIWEREGRRSGKELEYWLRAERELASKMRRAKERCNRKPNAITVAHLPGVKPAAVRRAP